MSCYKFLIASTIGLYFFEINEGIIGIVHLSRRRSERGSGGGHLRVGGTHAAAVEGRACVIAADLMWL
jgi:hypothetical protein